MDGPFVSNNNSVHVSLALILKKAFTFFFKFTVGCYLNIIQGID